MVCTAVLVPSSPSSAGYEKLLDYYCQTATELRRELGLLLLDKLITRKGQGKFCWEHIYKMQISDFLKNRLRRLTGQHCDI